MNGVKQNGATVRNYRYNGKGERTRGWMGSGNNTYTLYDESGHWLGDYDNAGTLIQQAIWLDDLPVGLQTGSTATLSYIEPDHLGSPRVVIDPVADTAIWKWNLKGEAFGATAPEEDPDGNGIAFTLDLRFPGQRYDRFTGLNYNYFRDYEPGTGRYIQSDPIGLDGGTSTYAYVGSDPLELKDPEGLQGRRAMPAPPLTTSEVFARAQVPNLIRRIQTYEPSFRYQTVGPSGYRYNRQDVNFLEEILNQHRTRENESCPAPINYGWTPGGIPLSRHYSTERVDRNIPVSLLDSVVNNYRGQPSRGALNYYDPVNDVTVVIGNNGVITSHRGK